MSYEKEGISHRIYARRRAREGCCKTQKYVQTKHSRGSSGGWNLVMKGQSHSSTWYDRGTNHIILHTGGEASLFFIPIAFLSIVSMD